MSNTRRRDDADATNEAEDPQPPTSKKILLFSVMTVFLIFAWWLYIYDYGSFWSQPSPLIERPSFPAFISSETCPSLVTKKTVEKMMDIRDKNLKLEYGDEIVIMKKTLMILGKSVHQMELEFKTVVEKLIIQAFKLVVDAEKDPNSQYHFYHYWLNTKLTDSLKVVNDMKKMSVDLSMSVEKISREMQEDKYSTIHRLSKIEKDSSIMKSDILTIDSKILTERKNIRKLHSEFKNNLQSLEAVMQYAISKAIGAYDADKTGKADFALESAGGNVVGTRCSETYTEKEAKLGLLGIWSWYDHNTPRKTIQPTVHPGDCWAFKGSIGYLVIQLAYAIHPKGFTLEHIPLSLSLTGSLDSAPKDFSVWGLESENDIDGVLLGNYSYDLEGGPLQYFPVQEIPASAVGFLELKIHSNHGNIHFTCLYRIRVHGTRGK